MKNSLALALIAAAAAAPIPGQTVMAPSHQPFSIAISTARTSVKAGAAVWVRIRLTNTSDHEINASVARAREVDVNYDYDVRQVGGGTVDKLYKHDMSKIIQTVVVRALKPGEATEEESRVSRMCKMIEPGEYAIQVSRPISDDPGDGVVKSNTITVTVTP